MEALNLIVQKTTEAKPGRRQWSLLKQAGLFKQFSSNVRLIILRWHYPYFTMSSLVFKTALVTSENISHIFTSLKEKQHLKIFFCVMICLLGFKVLFLLQWYFNILPCLFISQLLVTHLQSLTDFCPIGFSSSLSVKELQTITSQST